MRAWLIVATWWLQGPLDDIRRAHLTTDPKCERHRPPRGLLARASRDLECERCMVRRAFGWQPPPRSQ